MTAPNRVCALTGAHGYVGGVLRRALQSAGWSVVALSRRAAPGGGEIPWSLGEDGDSLEEQLKQRGVSALVHAAWDLALVRPRDLQRVNVQGSLRLLAQARAANLRRTVFISSISAFAGARSLYGQTKMTVERAVQESGGIVIRPGMVYGKPPGGMFAALQRQAGRAPAIPVIGDGSYPQYLAHEDDLASAVVSALAIQEPPAPPVTVAHPRPWPLRSLLRELAAAQGKAPRFVPIPWPFAYGALRLAEAAGLRTGFRSDSVLSLVCQNPRPEMNAMLLGVEPRPFSVNAQTLDNDPKDHEKKQTDRSY